MADPAGRPAYSVVVPVYQSSASVVELVERCERVFAELGESAELVLVDDGSTNPDTWPTLERLAAERPAVRAVRLMRNYGKANAVMCGLARARGAWIITLDDDLQQRPEDIPALVKHRDHDVVVANFGRRRHGPLTLVTSFIKSRFDRWILGVPCKMSPLKLFNDRVARGMLEVQTARPFIPALMAQVTTDFFPVVVEHAESQVGRSRYTLRKRFSQFFNLLIGNSSFLLRLFGAAGIVMALAGFAYAGRIVYRTFTGPEPPPGWASLIVINLVFGGTILALLGVIGDYLIRILQATNRTPTYAVRDDSAAD